MNYQLTSEITKEELYRISEPSDSIALQFIDYVAQKYGMSLLEELYTISYYGMTLSVCIMRYGNAIFHDLVNQVSELTNEAIWDILKNFSLFRTSQY